MGFLIISMQAMTTVRVNGLITSQVLSLVNFTPNIFPQKSIDIYQKKHTHKLALFRP